MFVFEYATSDIYKWINLHVKQNGITDKFANLYGITEKVEEFNRYTYM